ncbi:dynamin family protein [Natroniella sp. ANB-PHB2]|uniref:dynamin family protein n=1 Tax=Natroniella sp. ANB-PHB2 TaxID=3384444 RepID=UPI0038D3C1C5
MELKEYITNVQEVFSCSPIREVINNNEELPGRSKNIEKILIKFEEGIQIEARKLNKPLKLVLMGEVKAGKSTVLNALAGGEVSPVNVTEATATIIEVAYSEYKSAEIKRGSAQNIKGTPEKIFNVLSKHHGDLDFFADCEYVKLELPLANLRKINMVDTPGLATVTLQNEVKTKDYIQESDVVLWVFNVHHLGQADVEEALTEVAELGKPIIGIVNRIDEIDENPKEIIEYVEDQYMIYIDKCFGFSAYQAFNGVKKNEEELLKSSGYLDLLEYLENDIEREADKVQEESIFNSIQALIRQDLGCHELYVDKLEKLEEQINKHYKEIQYHNSRIKEKFEGDLKAWVNSDFLHGEEIRLSKMVDDFSMFSNKDKKQKLEAEMKRLFSAKNIRNSLEQILEEVNDNFEEEWKLSIDEVKSKMERDFKRIASREEALLGQLMEDNFFSGTELAKEGAGKGAAIGGAIGTTAATYAALLGPYASTVTIGTALGALLPPYLIGGAVVGAVTKFVNFKSQKRDYKKIIRDNFREIKKDYVGGKIIPDIISNLKEQSDKVANEVHQKFVVSVCSGLKEEELGNMKSDINDYCSNLKLYLNQSL